MTQHVPPPQGRRVIVCEIGGITRPDSRTHHGTRLMSREELAMLTFRRDLYRKKLQHRYDIKLFREQFHRDMAAFEAQLEVLRREEERKAAKNNHWQDQPRRPKGTEGAGQFSNVLDAGTVHPNPPEGEGGKGGPSQDPSPPSTQVAQATGTLSDVVQPLLGDTSAPGEATAVLPLVAPGAVSAALAALRAVGPAIARLLFNELFSQKPSSDKPAGIGHNSGDAEPLDQPPPPTPPPNPLPGAVGAAAAVSQARPDAAPSHGFVSLRDDQKYGGHGYDRHINITRQGIADRALDMARNYTGSKDREFAASRFFLEAEADALVRQVLDAHPDEVAAVRSGNRPDATLQVQFNQAVGEQAYIASRTAETILRAVNRVRVVIKYEPLSSRGYIVLTAYPVP